MADKTDQPAKNPHLLELHQRLQNDHGDQAPTVDELVHALYLLSAPYGLIAIVAIAQRFMSLLELHPGLAAVEVPDLDRRIDIWRQIAEISTASEAMMMSRTKEKATPLRPWTCDGPPCDLMYLTSEDLRGEAAFDKVVAWFTMVSMLWIERHLPFDTYRKYITRPDPPKKQRLRERDDHHFLGEGFRHLRKLCDDTPVLLLHARQIGAVSHLDLFRRALALKNRMLLLGHSPSDWMDPPHDLDAPQVLEKLSGIPAQELRDCLDELGRAPKWLRRLFLSCFQPVTERRKRYSDEARLSDYVRDWSYPKVRVWGAAVCVIDYADYDDQTGLIAALHEPPGEEDDAAAHTEETVSGAGATSIVLFDEQDMIKASYRARSQMHYVSRRSACLPWDAGRPSAATIEFLLQRLQRVTEYPKLTYRCLAGTLVLATGRTIAECRKTRVAESVVDLMLADPMIPMGIDPVRERLVLRIPDPPTSGERRDGGTYRTLLHSRVPLIEINLPPLLKLILEHSPFEILEQSKFPSQKALSKTFTGAPPEIGLSATRVAKAIQAQLMFVSQGDIGVVYAITGSPLGDAINIGHYAAYPVEQLSALWGEALSRVSPLLDPSQTTATD